MNLVDADIPIRVAKLAADAQIGVLIKAPLEGFKTRPDVPGYFRGELQIIVRHTNPVLGNEIAQLLADELTLADTDIGTYRIKQMYPLQLPVLYPANEADLYEIAINFDCAGIRL